MQNQSPVETRYTMNYSGLEPDIYGHHAGADSYMNAVLQQHVSHNNLGHGLNLNAHHGLKRTVDNVKQEPLNMNLQDPLNGLDLGVSHGSMSPDDDRSGPPSKKTPPPNGKKTKGRVKIKMEFIDNKLRRYTTFSKRKTGIMKKAYELSTLTGTQVMLLVASETGHVYTFATRKLQPMITSEAGKALIQTCLNSPDPLNGAGDQRMSATGFEETELTYNVQDDDQKVRQMMYSGHIPPASTPHHILSHPLQSPQYGGMNHPHHGLLPPVSNSNSYPMHGSPTSSPHSHHFVPHGLSSPSGSHMTLSPAPTPQPHQSR